MGSGAGSVTVVSWRGWRGGNASGNGGAGGATGGAAGGAGGGGELSLVSSRRLTGVDAEALLRLLMLQPRATQRASTSATTQGKKR